MGRTTTRARGVDASERSTIDPHLNLTKKLRAEGDKDLKTRRQAAKVASYGTGWRRGLMVDASERTAGAA